MARIVLDFDPAASGPLALGGDTSDLVYFLSWAFSARYGGNHEMSVASLALRGEYGIDLRPLLTFADRNVEVDADAEMLERAWQDAAPLAECCEAVARALRGRADPRLTAVADEYPRLVASLEELGRVAARAAAEGRRIRVTFVLEEDT